MKNAAKEAALFSSSCYCIQYSGTSYLKYYSFHSKTKVNFPILIKKIYLTPEVKELPPNHTGCIIHVRMSKCSHHVNK
jgi:hypothetical protein